MNDFRKIQLQEKLVIRCFESLQRRKLTEQFRSHVGYLSGISWNTRVAGVLISIFSMHLLVVRPLVDRVDQLQAELNQMDATLSQVVGRRSSIQQTNDLLSGLSEQHERAARARATVRQLELLQSAILREAEQLPEALESVRRMSELPRRIFEAEVDRSAALSMREFPLLPVPDKASPPPLEIRPLRVPDSRLDEQEVMSGSEKVTLSQTEQRPETNLIDIRPQRQASSFSNISANHWTRSN